MGTTSSKRKAPVSDQVDELVYLRELERLKGEFDTAIHDYEHATSSSRKQAYDRWKATFVSVCSVIRRATKERAGNVDFTVLRAEELLIYMLRNETVSNTDEFLSSFSQENLEDLVQDPAPLRFKADSFDAVFGASKQRAYDQAKKRSSRKVKTYEETPRLHPHSSRIARFRTRDISVTNDTPLARAVFQARLSSTNIISCAPVRLCIPPDSSVMVEIALGGFTQRDPVLSYFDLAGDTNYDGFPDETGIEVGLAAVAQHVALDPRRKLIYVADDNRIKSYGYGVGSPGSENVPRHTMNPKAGSTGPISLIQDGGKLLRAGRGVVEVWNIDRLATHGPSGTRRIGRGEVLIENSFREDIHEIETSIGSSANSTFSLPKDMVITEWLPAPSSKDSSMIAAHDMGEKLWSLDLNANGRPTNRYLGHAGEITSISSSPGDPLSVLTSCRDGIVRLFDIRQSLPRLCFDAGAQAEPIDTSLYIHVEGIPLVVVGCLRSECIKVFDPRMRTMLYELATGNNAVTSLAWDAPRNTLYAGTDCAYVDRLGYNHGYRRAKIPRSCRKKNPLDATELDDEEGVNDDDCYWPTDAPHSENYFGYAFDNGRHQLLRYKFGADADPMVLPQYGDAQPTTTRYGNADEYLLPPRIAADFLKAAGFNF